MPLTRLDNLISSKTGKYLYVSPDDFNATDALSNRGNSPVTPFKSIQRAFLEIARYSYLPGFGNDRFDQFSIMLMPGIHYIDNRPGLVDTSGIDTFGFDQANNEWTDNSILDISNPDNVLYKFNNTEGGAIIPRGSSLVGYDLRRTVVRPLYVPDPASVTVPRSAIFNVTGGCYFWQFTLKDGQTTAESPLYNSLEGTGEVYYDPNDFTRKTAPNYSHHKLTVFEYADTEELGLFYRKIAKSFSDYQPTIDDPGEFDFRIQENRIVGPLSDSRVIESLTLNDATTIPSIAASTSEIEVTTKVDHGYFAGQFVAISNTDIDSVLEGIFPIIRIDQNDPRKFTYEVAEVVSAIGTGIAAGQTVSVDTTPALGQNAQTLAEVDSVESASPYVFNVSIRSTWGICGIWANGLKATGFKSMVIAQYTGVSLQKDDRAFIRYDEYSNTWNQASLTDAFATVPYHAKGDSYWKDDWRTFHVKASEDAFIQNVSIFAVGFADHFLMESGGDMSITNSNSNFGNTSLHAIGFKGFAFNQDKGGFLTDIIPPKQVETGSANFKRTQYYTIDIQGTIQSKTNFTRLYLGSEDITEPINRPAVTIGGYRLGAKSGERLYVKLDPLTAGGTEEFNAALEPTGFVKYIAAPSILNPSGFSINSTYADAANLIESNRRMIQEEVFGYILEKYPRLQNISYVNPGRDPQANRYFDARNLIVNNRQEIINETLASLSAYSPTASISTVDIGEMVDAVAEDLRDGGNYNTITLIQTYFAGDGSLSKYNGQQEELLWAFNRARDLCKQAIANLLSVKADLYDPSGTLPDLSLKTNNPCGPVTNGKTGSQAEIDGDTTDGVTIDLSNKDAKRYKTTYNLIQSNKDYVLDNSLAEISTYDTSPFFTFPGDPAESATSRFKTAYRFIRRNKADAQAYAVGQIQTLYPTFTFPGNSSAKCSRDLGFFIDAIGMDIFLGGNAWTRAFITKYFDNSGNWVVGGLQGEELQSVAGFNAVRDYLQDAISNQLSSGYQDLTVSEGEAIYGDGNGDISNIDSNACSDVQNALGSLTSIATQVIGDGNILSLTDPGNANYVTPTVRTLTAGEIKCRRDIGHIVDAVQQDLWFGGNAYSIAAAKAYFNRFGLPISNGLVSEEAEGIVAFKRAADAINLAINNQLYYWDQTITLDTTGDPAIVSDMNADAYNLVLKNKEYIAEEAYLRMQAAYPGYVPQATNTKQDCLDDVYSILEEVMYDVKFGGNAKTYDSAEIYTTNVMPYFGPSKRRKDFTPTTVSYDPATGLSVFTIPGHDMTQGGYIKVDTNGVVFTCSMDGNQTQHASPSADDPYAGQWMQITAADASTITVNVGASQANQFWTPTNAVYNSTTGDMEITIGNHSLSVTEGIVLADNSFTFTCDQDGNVEQKTYPRPGQDPWAGKSIAITAVSATTITVNVGDAGSAAGVPHTFITAATDAVKHLPQSAHTFVSAATDCIHYGIAAATFIDPERDEAAEVFTQVKNLVPSIIRNQVINSSPSNSEVQYVDSTVTTDWDSPTCVSVISATQSNLDTIIQAIGTDNGGVGDISGITRTAPVQPQNLIQNGVNQGYTAGNCSDVVSSVNTLISIVCDAISAGSLTTLPTLNNGEWDCANVRSTIETLFDIANDAFVLSSLSELPVLNRGSFTTDASVSKCFRDVSYIVDAVVSDLRLGGNINSVQAGEAYYVGNQLEYIDGEKTETIDAWNYVGQMATAAMRNFDVLAFNCSTTAGSAIVNINDTRGILIGMTVAEYDNTDVVNPAYVNGLLQSGSTQVSSTIPLNTYVKRIVSGTQIELGVANSRLDSGSTITALQTSSSVDLYFDLPNGQWANTLPKTDPSVIQDTLTSPTQRECAGTADAIETLVGNITTIINSGLGSVDRQEQTASISAFASRATVFTINTSGVGASNPHNFETGTPVRLVPRPRFDVAKGQYVDVDKRLVRLPNGFETNKTYYVIAPGRRTQPEDYSTTTFFNGSDQTKLMLSTSRENAAAGIYIYSSESESIDANVEIDIYQFILDEKYDLHNYKTKLTNSINAGIQTDVSHIFDTPFASVTPQKVFFRDLDGGRIPLVSTTYASDADVAIQNSQDSNFGRIDPTKEFYARYQNDSVITIHKTHADAINNVNPITFTSGQTQTFQVFSNKRRAPFAYDPAFSNGIITTGKWFVRCVDESSSTDNIFFRIQQSDYGDRPRSTDMWFTRLEDDRGADDRTYKLRYVIPKYLENARDPINGFVIKTRTDDTRKLVPQKVVLKPVAGTVYGARFENKRNPGEFIGFTQTEYDAQSLTLGDSYDPYKKVTGSGLEYRMFAKFSSGIQATIQSGRYVEDTLDPNIKYLELTLFDHGIDTLNFSGLRNESFTTVKISAPQGGEWVVNKTASVSANQVQWTGNSSGLANIHAYYTVGGQHYLIIKNVRGGKLEFSEYYNTRFEQGSTFADMLEDQDMGKSLPLKTLIAKNYPQYFYKQNGSNVYTITPGDRIQDDAGIEYYVDSVEDAGVIEDTFYVFSYETLQRRIAGQQDGIYYLSCLRGNISPFPTGAGVAENFKKFKFSQPVSSLYPLDYKNDPLWFQKNGTTAEELNVASQLLDPPPTFSAADNYTQGLVTTNDFKNSVTRELVEDLIDQPAFNENNYIAKAIEAQVGNATSGSEDRKIPIAGDSTVLTDQRYYVELRRPSIARAGNHTFEYLGFGPGNYSTGLPARQEIVLSPDEDFYAQSKKEDGGIVFYTGLNSNGDLYIGNRKINAITGEETFLERATLQSSADDDEDIGNLVTSFDTPVTFNQNITVVGGDGSQQNVFQSPLIISVQDNDLTEVRDALIIRSNVSSVDPVTGDEQDESLDRTNFAPPTLGDIRISKNRIQAAVFGFNARGKGQAYEFKTHITNGVPSNISPNNSNLVAQNGNRLISNQFVDFGGVAAKAGDVLFKGKEIGKTGSLGWVFSNYFTQIPNNNIFTIEFDGTNVVKLTFKDNLGVDIPNSAIGITSGSQIRLNDYIDSRLTNVWTVFSPNGDAFDLTNNYVHFQVNDNITIETLSWNGSGGVLSSAPAGTNPSVDFSNSSWKEQGVIGAETLRTETENIGDYKLGVNTIARSDHAASQNAFISNETEPRANLDVVGNTFISGKKILSYLTETSIIHVETNQDNAFLVGGDSANPSDISTLRVMTTNSGRLGVNTAVNDTVNPINNLDRNFVVIGDSRFSDDANFQADIEVNGGDITTTNNAFNFINSNAQILNFAGDGQILNLMNNQTVDQSIAIGNSTTRQTILVGEATQTGTLKIHRNTDDATVDIATVSNNATSECKITLGGAWATQADATSYTKIGTFYTGVAGNLEIGTGWGAGTSESRLYAQTRVVNLFDGDQTNTVNLATNATTFTLGSTGGTTFIRNTLNVLASTIVEGNIRLDGGLNAGIIKVGRGKFGTTIVPHLIGGVENPNIDFYKYETTGKVIDTAGVSQWGSTSFLVAGGQIASVDTITNNGANNRTPGTYSFLSATSSGAGSGSTFTIIVRFDYTIDLSIESPGEGYADNEILTITDAQLGGGGGGDLTFQVNGTNSAGTSYYLPISQPVVGDFQVGDLLFLDRANTASPDSIGTGANVITGLRDEAKSEILRIIGIANIANPSDPNGYRLIVSRGAEGTGTYTDHPDGCVIAKFTKQGNASYITGSDLDDNGELDDPLTGIGAATGDVNIGVAEFGGTISLLDYIRLSSSEFVSIVELISTSPQSLIVNDGGNPAADVFKVESTTGDTYIFGDIFAGVGFNKFTVDSGTGNTITQGSLTTNNTITLRGSTFAAIKGNPNYIEPGELGGPLPYGDSQLFKLTPQGNTEFLTLSNGGRDGVVEAVTFQVDTATGSIYSTGDLEFYGTDITGVADLSEPRLIFNNSSGDFTTYGSLSALGTGTSTFGGPVIVGGDLTVNGGDLTVNSNGTTIFDVANDGAVTVAGISDYFSQTGGRKWVYTASSVVECDANVNYFINCTGNTLVKLPPNPLMGDMVRIIDIGGALTYNISMVVRADNGNGIQGETSNTGTAMLTGISPSELANYNAGELVVQTPRASFGLVYAGTTSAAGGPGAPTSLKGWYLMDV
ncbi:short tail fiber protein [Synechococcus phage ACG-2014e]|uniref:Putative short tail fiber n=1 Tax=Synechococcus phage ACG-2014e TaxID=1493510 RepID=A0A0E3HHE7_9CAUD|nr:short tail fiber protein [Synechococcus phage ACG-2014e]YP_010355640.1 short tail fiber protein [Synechococcus phage ACG-2014e]AIX20491.1 putative short tail fiber [Synechococcus phage ACG-2014e]AIX29708.1 putative short tail fiber [Synechococcus phage ACG-2014e]AIX44947.1 putative short tail fiber [Synechococcus phage ACG-2014e]